METAMKIIPELLAGAVVCKNHEEPSETRGAAHFPSNCAKNVEFRTVADDPVWQGQTLNAHKGKGAKMETEMHALPELRTG